MDWQLTCRVCLESGDMVSLFDWDENKEQLGDKYTYCCGITVATSDSLPTLICLPCVDKLTLAYQFKQQCISSNDTLKECLLEFKKSSAAVASTSKVTETETITIKQENGMLLQYELPIEHDPDGHWTRTAMAKSPGSAVVTKAPGPKKRGRPRKYPNEHGQIDISPYTRKKERKKEKEEQSLTQLLENDEIGIKDEPEDEPEPFGDYPGDDDPDFEPQDDEEVEKPVRKRGRPRKIKVKEDDIVEDNGEDMLLKETILAFSEPIPDHILNPKPKKKYPYKKKKKTGSEKTHTCETCGSSFTSNASLQAHIRRHLGIKPFVCSACGFATNNRLGLQRHMIRHTGVKPHQCRYCERRFFEHGDRQKHERLHMGVRPYQCSLCGKSFTYSYVLANHMLTHTGEKKYSCGICNKKFTKAHHLKYHNKVHHKDIYLQQQLEAEAKKVRQQINVSGLSGVVSGHIVDGQLLIQGGSEGGQLLVQEGSEGGQLLLQEGSEDGENDRAVAGMQAVVLDTEFMEDDDKSS